MDAATAEKSIKALNALRDQCWRMYQLRDPVNAYIKVAIKGADGYSKELVANSEEASKIAVQFWRDTTQRHINRLAREVRGCGVEVPADLVAYVTNYPIVPGAITNA